MRDDLDPAVLLANCRERDPRRRRDAYHGLGIFLARIARARLQGRPELAPLAEDCAQEALVAVWRKLEAGQGPDAPQRFLGWCAAIAVHKVYDALRRQGHVSGGDQLKRVPPALVASLEALAAGDEGGGQAAAGPAFELADPAAASPEQAALDRAALAGLVATVRNHRRLSEHSRRILLQGYLAEATDAELAEDLGVSHANVQVIRSRNLKKLREDRGLQAALRGDRPVYASPGD
jgi:RNA polymerase sigma factor (sigma-70 family)